jgi:hypothetical protein
MYKLKIKYYYYYLFNSNNNIDMSASSSEQTPNNAPTTATPTTPPTITTIKSTKSSEQVVDPVVSIYVFTGITLVYFIFKYLMPERESVLFIIYFILVLASQFGLNVYLAKQMCNSPSNVGTAALATFLPWIFIFGLLNLLLGMFPGWLSAFSNTIGYAIASVAGVASLFTDQLLNVGNPPSKDAFKVIQNVTNDPSTIINTINDEDLENFWNNSIKVQFFNSFKQVTPGVEPPPQYTQLKNFIRLKNIVSYFIWYLLTGILITSVSYNYMLSVPCVQTPKQARQSAAQFIASQSAKQQASAGAKANMPVYKTDGK